MATQKKAYGPYIPVPLIYGLMDHSGTVVYVGKTKNMRVRIATYKRGDAHKNKKLARHLQERGAHWCALSINPENLEEEEFKFIQSMPGLLNIVKDRDKPAIWFERDAPWYTPDLQCPTGIYRRQVANRFGKQTTGYRDFLRSLSAFDRVCEEIRMARELMSVPSLRAKVIDWVEALLNGGLER